MTQLTLSVFETVSSAPPLLIIYRLCRLFCGKMFCCYFIAKTFLNEQLRPNQFTKMWETLERQFDLEIRLLQYQVLSTSKYYRRSLYPGRFCADRRRSVIWLSRLQKFSLTEIFSKFKIITRIEFVSSRAFESSLSNTILSCLTH